MMASSTAEVQLAYEQAADWFVRTLPTAEASRDVNALGEWTVRDLVGHTSRAFSTVENYLSSSATTVEVSNGLECFPRVFVAAGNPEVVAQRGRDAGAALVSDPARAVAEIVQPAQLQRSLSECWQWFARVPAMT